VVKGGATANDPHGVDAISGGTITSKGLESMLFDCLSGYQNYFDKVKKQLKS
jgi:Na+-transporting NADH:ubiquinone oxidoreductase subunit C